MTTARNRLRKLFFRGAEMVPGNRVRLLQGGAEFFAALIAVSIVAGALYLIVELAAGRVWWRAF